jgi:hypothetical protein
LGGVRKLCPKKPKKNTRLPGNIPGRDFRTAVPIR